MAIEESLHKKLDELFGEEHAAELMKRLPAEEPATKIQVERLQDQVERLQEHVDERFVRADERSKELEQRVDLKLEALEGRMVGEFHRELSALGTRLSDQIVAQTRNYIFSMVGAMVALATATRLL